MKIRQTCPRDAAALSAFYTANAEHLQPWEPLREEGHHSVEAWRRRLISREEVQIAGQSAHFAGISGETGEIIAVCSLTNIVRGPFLACNMGYAIALRHQGKGLMKALCLHVIDHAFNDMGLHRIMANYMPSNRRSARLLQSLGFEREGLAKEYLRINGRWENHILTSLINPHSC